MYSVPLLHCTSHPPPSPSLRLIFFLFLFFFFKPLLAFALCREIAVLKTAEPDVQRSAKARQTVVIQK